MARRLTFLATGSVNTRVTITENEDSTLTFDIAVVGDTTGDLRALFFDLSGFTVAEGDLYVVDQSGTDVTDTASGEASVDTLGQDANIKGSVSNKLGDFDVGIEFGTSGTGKDDIQTTSFTLASHSVDLTLDMLSFADFGFRYTSVGTDEDRTASAKIGATTGGIAVSDAVTLEENTSASLSLTANDTASGTVEAQSIILEDANGQYGTLTIAADGTATITADGEAADALNDGESASFVVSYAVLDGDTRAEAMLTITITGVTDEVRPALFTEGHDIVDFALRQGGVYNLPQTDFSLYDPASFYDAGAGDDYVLLPTLLTAAAVGFDLTQTFYGGAGRDTLYGSDGDDRVDFGTGANETYVDWGGDDTVSFLDTNGTVRSGRGGNDVFYFADGARNVLNYYDEQGGVTANMAEGWASGTYQGTAWQDIFTGTVTDISTGNGDDVVYGWSEKPAMQPYLNVTLWDGNDTFIGSTASSEVVRLFAGTGTGHKILDGGIGSRDYMVFNGIKSDMVIDALNGTYSGWGTGEFTGFEEYQLGDGSDTFIGSNLDETIMTRIGNDTVFAGGGRDVLQEGSGNGYFDMGDGADILGAFLGQDTYIGGEGNDVILFTDAVHNAGVEVDLSAGTVLKRADGTTSTISGFEVLRDSRGDDLFIGSDGNETFNAVLGNDTITGNGGADTFLFEARFGSIGNDVITDFNRAEGDGLAVYNATWTATEVGSDVVLELTNAAGADLGTITLLNLTLAEFY